mmetsp:Transcript_13489/g.22220  ORF Transcript_13489/g.22220 Transcript_13489/m.22220 type:complete len:153 (+) Transcript_13489:62-520(+)
MPRTAKDLSDDVLQEFKDAFQLFDKDGNGTIDKKELKPVLCILGHEPTKEEVSAWMDEYDKGKTGTLTRDEFIDMMASKTEDADSEQALKEAFRVFDKDVDGHISKTELHLVMTNLGEKLSEEEADELVSQADGDGDRLLNYKEFKDLIGAA